MLSMNDLDIKAIRIESGLTQPEFAKGLVSPLVPCKIGKLVAQYPKPNVNYCVQCFALNNTLVGMWNKQT